MGYIKKFFEMAEPVENNELNLDVKINTDSITIGLDLDVLIKVSISEGKKELDIKKEYEIILDGDTIKKIVEKLHEVGGGIKLNEDDVDEISKVLFTYVVDKKESIVKSFTLLTGK